MSAGAYERWSVMRGGRFRVVVAYGRRSHMRGGHLQEVVAYERLSLTRGCRLRELVARGCRTGIRFNCMFCFISADVGPCKLDGVDNVIPVSGETGRLFSPKFPRGTPPRSIMCTWIITVPEGHFVKLRLMNVKLVDDDGTDSKLVIRDGRDASSALLKTFNIVWHRRSLFSSGRYLWVRFQSPRKDFTYYFSVIADFEAVTQCKYKINNGQLNNRPE